MRRAADTHSCLPLLCCPLISSCRNEQKWSKGKTRDKLNNACLFKKDVYEKLMKEVPSYKLITPSIVSDRLKIKASLANKALQELVNKGQIREVVKHNGQRIYTRIVVE